MIRRRLHETPPHVRDLLPDLPRRVDTLIVHMLARSPKDRLASAAEARDAMDPALMLGGWDPGSISSPGPAANLDASLRPTIPMPRVRTSPKRIAIGSLIGSTVLLTGMWLWSQPPKEVAVPIPSFKKADSTAQAPKAIAPESLPKLAKDTVVKPKPQPTSEFDAPLARLAAAIRTKDIANVRAAYPGLPDNQRATFEGLFAKAGGGVLRVNQKFGAPTISGTTATRTLTLEVVYSDPNSLNSVRTPMHYRANYEQKSGAWTLVSLQPGS
jgi:hypothetical protein